MKHVIEGEIGGTGWSYWLTLRKRDDSGWRRKHWISHSRGRGYGPIAMNECQR
jgi:hypothetical protein